MRLAKSVCSGMRGEKLRVTSYIPCMKEQQASAARWLKTMFLIGAVLDGIAAMLLVWPEPYAALVEAPGLVGGPELSYVGQMAAALMLGWTVLLVWAARAPLERRGIAFITVVPVVTGLVIAEVVVVSAGLISAAVMAPTWVLQALLVVFFLEAYRRGCVAVASRARDALLAPASQLE